MRTSSNYLSWSRRLSPYLLLLSTCTQPSRVPQGCWLVCDNCAFVQPFSKKKRQVTLQLCCTAQGVAATPSLGRRTPLFASMHSTQLRVPCSMASSISWLVTYAACSFAEGWGGGGGVGGTYAWRALAVVCSLQFHRIADCGRQKQLPGICMAYFCCCSVP